MGPFDLTDEEWAIIEPLLPPQGRGPERKDDQKVFNGIFYILRTGAPWRDLPERNGPQTTVYNRYNRWGERGVWQGIFEALAQECEDALVVIDASIAKAHRTAAAVKGGTGFSPHSEAFRSLERFAFHSDQHSHQDLCEC
jgi:transposase